MGYSILEMAATMDKALRLVSEFVLDLYRLQEPAEVLRTVDRWSVILGISARTVQTHLEHVFAKLHVVSRAQAVAEALRAPRG